MQAPYLYLITDERIADMLTVLAETLFTASRRKPGRDHRDKVQWENLFQPDDLSRENVHRRYRFNPYRDLW